MPSKAMILIAMIVVKMLKGDEKISSCILLITVKLHDGWTNGVVRRITIKKILYAFKFFCNIVQCNLGLKDYTRL